MNLGSDDEAGPGLGVERQRSVDTASPGRRRRRGRGQSDVVKVISSLLSTRASNDPSQSYARRRPSLFLMTLSP